MSISAFVESIYTKLGVTLVLVLIFLTNIFYLVNIQACQQANIYLTEQNNALSRDIEQIDNQEAYQNSDLFEEKEVKSNGYRLKGEEVVNTALFEATPKNPDRDYIPDLASNDRSNFDRWLRLFGEGVTLEEDMTRCGW